MDNYRVTIKDIAEELGLSTATISNVLHGKTKKVSDKTVAKVQEKLESCGYIPNMAAVLLAQNNSRIVCVVISDAIRYENRMIEDPFVCGMINNLSKELSAKDYFMMLKEEKDINQVIRYASMWNMAGLILIGYCAVDYEKLRQQMHIPFVVVDAYTNKVHNYSDVGIDNIKGGYLAGRYLIEMGHKKIMYLSDNDEDCDHDRYVGLVRAMKENSVEYCKEDFKLLSPLKTQRYQIYEMLSKEINQYTAAFVASDEYAIEFMNFLQDKGIRIPEELSIVGFDDIPIASKVRPHLTTISQNLKERSRVAVELLTELIDKKTTGRQELLPVELVERDSVKNLKLNNQQK